MTEDLAGLAEAFSTHRYSLVYPHLCDDVRWRTVGGDEHTGRTAVVDACEASARYLRNVATTFVHVAATPGDGFVVMETLADYQEADARSRVASCDIYRFRDGCVAEITSYNVEISTSS